jgi:hypothetical protein
MHHHDSGGIGPLEPQLGTRIVNPPHRHAFSLVGHKHVFGVHMTQYTHEVHKYQVIFKLGLPEHALETYRQHRAAYPDAFIVLGNDGADEFCVPAIAAGEKTSFMGAIYHGMPLMSADQLEDPHFFPWDPSRTEPIISTLEVSVERLVLFRPFSHNLEHPEFATYYLFGEEDEAHMTTLQTARVSGGVLEPYAFGPDYDHVMSLEKAPDWLDGTLLKAGVPVSTPKVRLRDPKTGELTIPWQPPFEKGETVEVLYRGLAPSRFVTAGDTVLCTTSIGNSESTDPAPPDDYMHITPMPPRYMIKG